VSRNEKSLKSAGQESDCSDRVHLLSVQWLRQPGTLNKA